MILVRRIARPLLAAVFVADGVTTARRPGPRAERLGALGVPNAKRATLGAAVGSVVAGVALGTSRLPRLSALALAAGLVPVAVAEHPFWSEKDKAVRADQRTQLLYDAGLLGGL